MKKMLAVLFCLVFSLSTFAFAADAPKVVAPAKTAVVEPAPAKKVVVAEKKAPAKKVVKKAKAKKVPAKKVVAPVPATAPASVK